jgi:hypothetical protein
LYFDTTSGKARYLGLLVRAEKRFGRGLQLRVSYAFGSFVGNNGTATGTTEDAAGRATGFNNDDWNENYGPLPTDFRHVLNLAGTIALPFGVRLAANLSAHGRPPFSAYVAGMDFNGDGTNNDLLPGSRVNQFNRGLDTADLVRLVSDYNDTIAGTQTAGGQQAPVLTLPDHFAFNDNFATLDVRLERPFAIGPSVHLTAIVEIFNVLNTANFTNYGSNLAAPSSFGQPLSRVGQAFGSGGPRSAQLGLRLNF